MNRILTTAALATLIPILAFALTAEENSRTKSVGEPRASAEARALIEQIRKMENDRIQAGVRKDVEAVAAVTADDYVQIDWNGKVLDKAATLARIRSSEIRLQWLHFSRHALPRTEKALVGSDGELKSEFANDGVHPNKNGYAVMRPLALRAIGQAR